MSEKRDINIYIEDILDAINTINDYVEGFGNALELKQDRKAYDAVMRNFIVIGEAVNNIYDQTRKNYPEIEWKDIIDMRNILVHEYWGIDEKVVWDTIKKDLPKLEEIILKIQSDFKKISPETYES